MMRSGPGAFLNGRCLIMCFISEGLKALGGRDNGRGSSRAESTSEVWVGLISGLGENVDSRWVAKRSAFSSSLLAQVPSSRCKGGTVGWYFRIFFVAYHRVLSLVERECT